MEDKYFFPLQAVSTPPINSSVSTSPFWKQRNYCEWRWSCRHHFLCQNPSLYYSNQQLKRLYKKYFYEDKENESNQIQEDYNISIFSDDTEMNDLNSENYTEAKTSFEPEESPFNFTIEEKVILGKKTINLFKLH